jgi:hypothetical protein
MVLTARQYEANKKTAAELNEMIESGEKTV